MRGCNSLVDKRHLKITNIIGVLNPRPLALKNTCMYRYKSLPSGESDNGSISLDFSKGFEEKQSRPGLH